MPEQVMIMVSSGPETPQRCAIPFFYASLAAAMEYEVTMFFTMDGPLLLKRGVSNSVYPKNAAKPVSDFIQEALKNGVKLLVCTASAELLGLQPSELIDGASMTGGATMWQIATACKTVLSF